MRKIILLSFFGAAAACAQSFSIGAIGGAPFQDVVKPDQGCCKFASMNSSNYTVGAAARVGLPLNLRLEVDALYRPYAITVGSSRPDYSLDARQWRFPVLLQYRFHGLPVVKPFIEGGLSFDKLSNIGSAASALQGGPGTLLHTSATGIVLGGGADVKVPIVTLSAELRYTRDTVSHIQDLSNLNQAEILFGIHF